MSFKTFLQPPSQLDTVVVEGRTTFAFLESQHQAVIALLYLLLLHFADWRMSINEFSVEAIIIFDVFSVCLIKNDL
jgi:hypothetical protein